MTLYALLTDSHWGARNDHLGFLDYFEKFHNDIFFPTLEERGVKHIIHLGDLVDRRKYINYYTASRLRRCFLDRLIDYECTIIAGNHDVYHKDINDVNSLTELVGKARVIIEPQEDGEFLFLPWINRTNEKRSIELIEQSNARFVFGHLQLTGFEMHVGTFAEDGLDSSILSKFQAVYSGHFHHKSTRNNVHYLGAPYEITWNDYSDLRGFHLFDSESGELEFIQNPYSMFHKIIYNDSNTSLDELLEVDFDKFHKRYVKLLVVKKENPYWFEKFLDEIEKANPFDLQVVENHIDLDSEFDPDMIEQSQDTLSILKTYVQGMGDNIDKQAVEILLKDIYNEANLITA